MQIASIIEKEKIDFIEVSGGNFESPKAYQYISIKESTKTREAYFLDAAKNIKEAVGIPVMVTGGFRSRSIMEEALSSSATDLIGIGRPFIIDPSFPNKLFSGVMSVLPTYERNFPPAQEIPPCRSSPRRAVCSPPTPSSRSRPVRRCTNRPASGHPTARSPADS